MLPQPSQNPPTAHPSIKTPQELVHIKHKITLRQYKYWILVLKSYREAYEGGVAPDDGGLHFLPMEHVAKYLGYEPVRSELRADFEALRKEAIIYNVLAKDGKIAQRGTGFISEWQISANWVGYKLPDFLAKCIERLDLKNVMFQQLNWNIFNSFSGKYEAILYKLCKDYVGVQRTPRMPIAVFREYMGLTENEYAEFKDLNKFVISGPVKKINASKLADITVEVDFAKESRRVVSVQFLVKRKHQMDLGFGDDPAFSAARITIALTQQQKYLTEKSADEIALAVERANAYADEQEKKGNAVNLGAIYQTAILQGWGAEYQSKLAIEEQKREQKTKAEHARHTPTPEPEQNPEIAARRQAALDSFDAMSEEGRANVLNDFMHANPALTASVKKNPGGRAVRSALAGWLLMREGLI